MSDFEEWRLQVRSDPLEQWRLLRKLVRQQVKRFSFPSPEQFGGAWIGEAVDDFIVELLEKKGVDLLLRTLERGTSQGHVERALLLAIEHRLIDQAKGTETGKLRRRLRTVLPEDPRFVHVEKPEEAWTLHDLPTSLWQGDVNGLRQAAQTIRGYAITAWNTAGPTSAEVKKALWEVSAGVISWAAAAVRAQDLAASLRERFELLRPLQVSTLEKLSTDAEPAATDANPATAAGVKDLVDQVWACLTADEQVAVLHVGDPVERWAQRAGFRPKQAELLVERVKEKVRLLVPVDEDTPATITLLRERAAGRA